MPQDKKWTNSIPAQAALCSYGEPEGHSECKAPPTLSFFPFCSPNGRTKFSRGLPYNHTGKDKCYPSPNVDINHNQHLSNFSLFTGQLKDKKLWPWP